MIQHGGMIQRWFDAWVLFLWIVALAVEECRQVGALQLTDIDVPEVVDYRATVTLSCSYDLQNEKLHSVKWYKGNREFFRYAPAIIPPMRTFPVEGVKLTPDGNQCNEFACRIRLTNLERHSGGEYRCEISGDAPQFELANSSRNMTVEALPQHDPIISGLMAVYHPGEAIEANCTSDQSSLGTRLHFFVNEKPVPIEYLQPPHETTLDNENYPLRFRTLEMHLPVDRLFPKGVDHAKLHIKCIAAIDSVRMAAGRETTTVVTVQSHHWWIVMGSSIHSGSNPGRFFPWSKVVIPLLIITSLLNLTPILNPTVLL
ncbi:uncharacterized protein LOC5571213 [Aedes aegypti]|uniref:Uncharacterized protein n=1 Tax=Aedes aegypti TaxID=7159 RepID=A0A6I8TBC6_AEDAE|nr:uncharacterized protein LOC5571213 [Aedes aegypti]